MCEMTGVNPGDEGIVNLSTLRCYCGNSIEINKPSDTIFMGHSGNSHVFKFKNSQFICCEWMDGFSVICEDYVLEIKDETGTRSQEIRASLERQ